MILLYLLINLLTMNNYSFTIPDSKERFNSEIKKLVLSYQEPFEEIPTKDGLVFSIEFSTDSQRIKFKQDLYAKFPYLYQ